MPARSDHSLDGIHGQICGKNHEILLHDIFAPECSAILGHTNTSFTLDTYTHVTSDMQKTASGIVGGFMEDIFGKELKPWQESEKPETEP